MFNHIPHTLIIRVKHIFIITVCLLQNIFLDTQYAIMHHDKDRIEERLLIDVIDE